MQTSSSQDKDSLTSETSIFKRLRRNLIGKSIHRTSGFTLTELIVVITILSILSVIGFVVMSHQSSVARDGKRISDIQTLSQSAKLTSAQLRKLPTPIADSVSLSVSGSFIGYQGFMSLALVNSLGYGSDKIYDPLDGTPYTYRVNQHYDQAQFMAYLENPRFERTIEIAGRGRIQEIASQSLTSALPSNLPSLFSQAYALDTAYALDSSTTDLSSRYPYSAGDRLGIFLSKGSKQPLQNGVSGTGSRDISLSDASTLDIMVGSQGADEYVSMDISTGALSSLKDGSFDEKALLGMNSGTGSGSGSGGGDSGGGGGGPVSHILTMGEYSVMGNTYYGYIGPLTLSLYGLFGITITTVTSGSLIDDTVDGYVIDSIFLNSSYQAPVTILAGSTNMPSSIAFETPYANIDCANPSVISELTVYNCTGSTVSTDFYVGSQHDLGITFPGSGAELTNTCGLLPEEITQLNSIQGGAQNSGQSWCDRTYLDFSNKGLTVLPSALSKLNQLEYLYFQNNSITELPTWVGTSFPSLYAFNGSNNLITSIPETFHPATIFANYPDGVVQIIRLANNQITSLPNSWNNTTISNVQQIDLTGNPALGSLSANLGQIGGGGCPSSDSVFTIRENYGVTTDGGGVRVIQSECLFPTFPGKIITWSPNTPAPGAAYSTVGYNAFETENHCGLTSAQVALMNESDAGYRQKMLLGEYSDGFSAQNFTGRKQLFSYNAQGSVGMYTAGWWCN